MKVGAEVSKRFVANVGGTLAGFLGTMYFTRVLGAKGFGIYAIFLSFQMLTGTLVTFGLFASVTKLVSEGTDQARHFATGLLFVFAGSAVAAVAFALLRPVVNGVLGVEAALIVPLGILSWSLFRLTGAFLEGEGKVALAGFVENFRYVPIVAIQTALVVAGLGVYGLLWGLIAGQFVTFGIAYAYARVIPARPSRALFGEFLAFSKYSYLQSVASQAFKHADYVLIGQFLGAGAAGIYKVSFTVTEAAMLFSAALSRVSFPEFSRLSADQRSEAVRDLLSKAVSYAGLFAIPALAGGAVIGNDLLLTVFSVRPGTIDVPPLGAVGLGNLLIGLLALANLFNGYRDTLEKYFLGTNRPRVAAASATLLLATYAAVFYPLIRLLDAAGLALTTAISFAVACLFLWWRLEYPVPRTSLRDVGVQAFAAAVMAGVVFVATGALGGAAGVVRLVAVLSIGAATYFALLVGLNERMRTDAKWVLRDLREEFPPGR